MSPLPASTVNTPTTTAAAAAADPAVLAEKPIHSLPSAHAAMVALRQAQKQHVLKYGPNNARAVRELVFTLTGYALAMLLVPSAVTPTWLVAVWLVFHLGWRLRIFMIVHDCGHVSFFTEKRLNDVVGEWLQLVGYTDFATWRAGHNRHHRVQGNQGFLDEAATILHSTSEFAALPRWQRVLYRIGRDPIVFTFVFPALYWMLAVPLAPSASLRTRACIPLQMVLTYCIVWARDALLFGGATAAAGAATWTWAIGLTLAASWMVSIVGTFLFHLQHGVNTGYRSDDHHFNAADAAIEGSTMLLVPWFARWSTFGIEIHHIHHLSTRVPSYRLRECHDDGERMNLWCEVVRVGAREAISSTFNVLWSDKQSAYVPFWPYHAITSALEGNENWVGVSSLKEDVPVPAVLAKPARELLAKEVSKALAGARSEASRKLA